MKNDFFNKNSDYFYLVFRVIIGVVFLLHALQKMPGLISGSTPLFGLMGLAFLIEGIGGIMIIAGIFTRYVAIVAAIEMLVAYFMVHIKGGLNPLMNKGEPAILFFAAFMVLIAFGSRRFSVDSLIKR